MTLIGLLTNIKFLIAPFTPVCAHVYCSCLKCIIVSLGAKFYGYLDDELLQLIFISLEHTNRFVRETGYNVCESIVTCGLVGKGKGKN